MTGAGIGWTGETVAAECRAFTQPCGPVSRPVTTPWSTVLGVGRALVRQPGRLDVIGDGHAADGAPIELARGVADSTPAASAQGHASGAGVIAGAWSLLGSAVNRVPGPRSGVNAQVSGVQGAQNRENA
jgi:hypothetical protein